MINALSPLDGRYNSHIAELQPLFSEAGLMKYRCHVEIAWMIFMVQKGIIPNASLKPSEIKALWNISGHFSLEDAKTIKDIEKTTNHDVKAIEYFLKEKSRDFLPQSCASFWHFCCTSEDINNLAYALMIREALHQILLPLLQELHIFLSAKAQEYAGISMPSHTHGQVASPTTLGKELANSAYRLARQIKQLQAQEVLGKFHGAVGNFNAHIIVRPDLDWLNVSQEFVESLGLIFNPMVTQIEPHDFVAELVHNFSRINTILIDFTRDMWMYISLDYFKLKVIAGEVGSSTMPHKVNPIDFENSEGNLGLANALFAHFAEKLPISRLQRDLTDSTVLRNIGSAFGYSLLAYRSLLKGLNKVNPNIAQINADLASRYEVLTEAVQTVLRYHGVPDAYEQLKAASRGQAFTRETYLGCVENLDLPSAIKTQLLKLSPEQYIGLAHTLSTITNVTNRQKL